jgi:signal peptidase I
MADQARHGRGAAAARRKPTRSFVHELPAIIVVALVISVLIKTFLVQAFYIPSASMENTLLINDRVMVNKLADKPDEIHRGDVVVFRDPGGWLPATTGSGGVRGAIRDALVFVGLAPSASERDLVKRVIGVGGDRVVCCDSKKRITVNGVPLTEPYLYPGDLSTPSAQQFSVKVPDGRLWMMGDHRSESADSRSHLGEPGGGMVPVTDVVGRAFVRVWPIGRFGVLKTPATFHQARLAHPGS